MAKIRSIARAILLAIRIAIYTGIATAGVFAYLNIPIEIPERIIYQDKPVPKLEELLATIPQKYGVSPRLARAIVTQESAGKPDAIRFEPGQMGRAGKLTKNPEQQRMYASSHGVMQVMGWHAPRFGISWSELYNPETNVEVGITILKECLDRHQGKGKYEQVFSALTCYNGSEAYSREVLARVAKELIEQEL